MAFKAGQTFSSRRRIKQRLEFERALQANCLNNKWFSIYLRANELGFSRLGIIVSKRTIPKAVARNFAKRMIRETFRCNFSANCSLDIVVRAKRQCNPESSVEGKLALIDLFRSVP